MSILSTIKGLFNSKKNAQMEELIAQNKMLMEMINSKANEERKANAQPILNHATNIGTEIINQELSITVDEVVKDSENIAYNKNIDVENADWKDLNRNNPEVVLEMKQSFREDMFSVGIDNIYELCTTKRTELLQDYLVSLLCGAGTFHKEWDNVDSWSREQIIDSIVEISFDNFKTAMERKGFKVKSPSENQLKKLKELGFEGRTPLTSVGASKLIESFVGKADTTPSEAQCKRISSLIERLGYQGENYTYSNKFEASKVIEELQKIADETLGAEKASKEQITYYAQLLKANGNRLTVARKEFAHNATKAEISKAINDLKEEIKKNHPEVSKGQLDYIISLHQRLMLGFNKDELAKLTKEEGTALIEKLNKQVLYMETRRYQSSLTMAQINAMNKDEVKEMLTKIQNDKKDRNPA